MGINEGEREKTKCTASLNRKALHLPNRDARLALLLDPVILIDLLRAHRSPPARSPLGSLPHIKHLPKLQVLVTTRRGDGGAIRTEARVQDPRLVRLRDVGHLGERGVGPDGQLVVGNAVRGEEFFGVRVEDERGDLRRGDERVEARRGSRVPKVDGLVRGSSSRSENRRVPRAPCESLLVKEKGQLQVESVGSAADD